MIGVVEVLCFDSEVFSTTSLNNPVPDLFGSNSIDHGVEHGSHDRVADGYSLVHGEGGGGPGIEVNAWNEDHRHDDDVGGAGGSCLPPCLP